MSTDEPAPEGISSAAIEEELKRLNTLGRDLINEAARSNTRQERLRLREAAAVHFRSAAELHPRAYLSRYYYGETLRLIAEVSGGDVETRRARYREAVKQLGAIPMQSKYAAAVYSSIAKCYHSVAVMLKDPAEQRPLFNESLRLYELSLEQKPEGATNLLSSGKALASLAGISVDRSEQEDLLRRALAKYEKVSGSRPLSASGLFSQGQLAGRLAGILSGPESMALLEKAAELLGQACLKAPGQARYFSNHGLILNRLSERTPNPTSRAGLLRQMGAAFQRASELDPTDSAAFYFRGLSLSGLAGLAPGDQRGELHRQAAERYAEGSALRPDYHGFFSYWGQALASQAACRDQAWQRTVLLRQALEKYSLAARLKPAEMGPFALWKREMAAVSADLSPEERDGLCLQLAEIYRTAAEENSADASLLKRAGDIQHELAAMLRKVALRSDLYWHALRLWAAAEGLQPGSGPSVAETAQVLMLVAGANERGERKVLYERMAALYDSDPLSEETASARDLCLWGLALAGQASCAGNVSGKRALLERALEKYALAAKLAPDDSNPWFFRGREFMDLAEMEPSAPAREAIYAEAAANYGRAAIRKRDSNCHICWSRALSRQAEATTDAGERRRCKAQAKQHAKTAEELKKKETASERFGTGR